MTVYVVLTMDREGYDVHVFLERVEAEAFTYRHGGMVFERAIVKLR